MIPAGMTVSEASTMSEMTSQTESIISHHLYYLAREDREKAYCDLHAVPRYVNETPELLQESLIMLKARIAGIIEKDAYQLAELTNPNYVHHPDFLLKFLRGEHFDPTNAAEKVVKHFQLKFDLFGASCLAKDIHQKDLEPEDINAMYSGCLQLLSMKDKNGRLNFVLFPGKKAMETSVMSQMRISFYLRMAVLEDVDIQRGGIGFILSSGDIESSYEMSSFKMKDYVAKYVESFDALPGTIMATHIMCPPRELNTVGGYMFVMFIQFFVTAIRPFLKVRVRLHPGSAGLSNLDTFGIQSDWIPRSSKDIIAFRGLLEKRAKLENSRILSSEGTIDNQNLIWIPSTFDVLLGRGRTRLMGMNRQGSLTLRNLIWQYHSIYNSKSRGKKKSVTLNIINEINKHGRFLKEESFGWVEISEEVARHKVSHAFRDLTRTKATYQKTKDESTDKN